MLGVKYKPFVLSVIILNDIMMSVIMLSFIMLSVAALLNHVPVSAARWQHKSHEVVQLLFTEKSQNCK